MTAPRVFHLVRRVDHSGVTGNGTVAEGTLWRDGSVTLNWLEITSHATFPTMAGMLAAHGHNGDTVVQFLDEPTRGGLAQTYGRVVPYLLDGNHRPIQVCPHPDHPDRLRLTFAGETEWRFWIALFDGSTDAAVHEEINGEWEHRWTSPDGDLWCIYYDRPQAQPPGTGWERHDDPRFN